MRMRMMGHQTYFLARCVTRLAGASVALLLAWTMASCQAQPGEDQLHGMVKSFAFWPQLTLGQPPLSAAEQTRVLDDCVDMFLGFHDTGSSAKSWKPAPYL